MPVADVSVLGDFEHVVLLAILRLGDDAYAVSIRDEILACTGRDVARGSIFRTASLVPRAALRVWWHAIRVTATFRSNSTRAGGRCRTSVTNCGL